VAVRKQKKTKDVRRNVVDIIIRVRRYLFIKNTAKKVLKDSTGRAAKHLHPCRKFKLNKGHTRNGVGHCPVRCRS